jgi:WD40 repeat protein
MASTKWKNKSLAEADAALGTLGSLDASAMQYAAVGADNRLRVWDTQSGKMVKQFTPPNHLNVRYSCLRWAPVPTSARASSSVCTRTNVACVLARSGSLPCLVACLLTPLAASPSLSPSPFSLLQKRGRKSRAPAAIASPLANVVALGNEKGSIVLWNIQSGEVESELSGGDGHTSRVHDIVFSSATVLYSCDADGYVIEWNCGKVNSYVHVPFCV